MVKFLKWKYLPTNKIDDFSVLKYLGIWLNNSNVKFEIVYSTKNEILKENSIQLIKIKIFTINLNLLFI